MPMLTVRPKAVAPVYEYIFKSDNVTFHVEGETWSYALARMIQKGATKGLSHRAIVWLIDTTPRAAKQGLHIVGECKLELSRRVVVPE